MKLCAFLFGHKLKLYKPWQMFVSFGVVVLHTALSDVTKCLRLANNNGQRRVSTNFAAVKVSLLLPKLCKFQAI